MDMTSTTTTATTMDQRTEETSMRHEHGGDRREMAVDGALGITMSRRRVLRLIGAAGATAVVAGIAQAAPVGAATAGNYRTTTDLNLRAKPSSSAKILLVMPEGAIVEGISGRKNGYAKVSYGGKPGWAYEAYLEAPTASGPSAPEIVGVTSTNTDVNLRSGPSTGSAVIRVLDPGAVVSYSFTIENGFRHVVHNGQPGWVWEAFLDFQAGPERRVTTSAVNHRAKASTSAQILAVIPEGAVVGDLEESANGFRKVSYNGAIGWCWADYLN